VKSPRNLRILFVEDDPDEHELIQQIFLRLDWQERLSILYDGEQLLEYLSGLPSSAAYPSLIVLDYSIPGLNGEATLLLLKKDPEFRKIPVFIFSTVVSPEKQKAMIRYGAAACIRKPINLEEYTNVIRDCMHFAENSQGLGRAETNPGPKLP
jgi:CheY-like chemotaxis protein